MFSPPHFENIRSFVRTVPDFPKPGIMFRDLTPLMANNRAFKYTVDFLSERLTQYNPQLIVAVESRGFIFGAPVAVALGIGFVPVRKRGKLPHVTASRTYGLEYGSDTLEIHLDAFVSGTRVAIVDDLLATGGTARATIDLVRSLGGQMVCAAFVVELAELAGRHGLDKVPVESLIVY